MGYPKTEEKAKELLHSFMDEPVGDFDITRPYAILVERTCPPLFKDREETHCLFETFAYPELHKEFSFSEAIFEFFTYYYSVLFCEPGEKGSKYQKTNVVEMVSELSGLIHTKECESLFECYIQLFNKDRDYEYEFRHLNPDFQKNFPRVSGENKFKIRVFNVNPEDSLAIIKSLQTLNFVKVAQDLKKYAKTEVSGEEDLRAEIDKFYKEMEGKVPFKYADEEDEEEAFWTTLPKERVKDAVSYGTMCVVGYYGDIYNGYYYTNIPTWTHKDVKDIANFDQEYILDLINKKRFPPKQDVL